MSEFNPYAPPTAHVYDVAAPAGAEVIPASRLARFGAAMIDSISVAVLFYGPITFATLSSTTGDPATVLAGVGLGALGGLILVALNVVFVARNSQSLGKKLVGLKVVRMDGSHASFARILFRRNAINWVLSLVPWLGAVYGIIDVLFIFSSSEQCLHDRIADTIVVDA